MMRLVSGNEIAFNPGNYDKAKRLEEAAADLRSGVGCKLKGSFQIYHVGGNFTISFLSFLYVYQQL